MKLLNAIQTTKRYPNYMCWNIHYFLCSRFGWLGKVR